MSPRLVAAALLSSLLLVMTASAASAALPGDLDPTFSSDGIALTNFSSGFDSANAVAVQVDTKIVAVGQSSGNGGQFALARYDSDGPLDAAGFSGDGKVTTDFTAGYDVAFDAALNATEKIVAVGRAGGSGGRFAVARYNTDGSLDTSFGGDGKATANFTSGDDFAYGVAIQPDGKIVVVGRAGGSGGVFAVVRFNPDGTLDTTFSMDGKATTNFTAGDDRADAVALQDDGKIVVAGSANYFGSNGKFALVRYNADGTPDTGFSGDGRLTTDFTPGFDGGFGIAVQSADQYIVAVGQAGLTLGLARYNTNGTLDTSFSTDGKATTNFTRGADYADDVVLQANGKIVAAGAANFFGPDAKFALARYNGTNGTLDTTFSGDGKLTANLTTGFDGAYGVALTPTEGIVAGGYAGGNGGRFAVVRYVG